MIRAVVTCRRDSLYGECQPVQGQVVDDEVGPIRAKVPIRAQAGLSFYIMMLMCVWLGSRSIGRLTVRATEGDDLLASLVSEWVAPGDWARIEIRSQLGPGYWHARDRYEGSIVA